MFFLEEGLCLVANSPPRLDKVGALQPRLEPLLWINTFVNKIWKLVLLCLVKKVHKKLPYLPFMCAPY